MLIPGSYSNGFAPRDLEPYYPRLWNGCIGAWCPSLGPSGATLREWSRQNHGTLSSLTLANAWTLRRGRYQLAFDGTGIVTVPGRLITSGPFTFRVWAEFSDLSANRLLIAQGTVAGGSYQFIGFQTSVNKIRFNVDASATFAAADAVTVVNTPYHIVGRYDPSKTVTTELFINGQLQGTTSTTAADFTAWDATRIGSSTTGGAQHNGWLDDILAANRAWTNAEIMNDYLLGAGAMFAMRQRRRVRSGGNRRRRYMMASAT